MRVMNFGKCNFYLRKANFDDIVASSAGILQEKEGRRQEWEMGTNDSISSNGPPLWKYEKQNRMLTLQNNNIDATCAIV